MIVEYRNDYRKIVMGLLSFIPDLSNYDQLEQEMDWSTSGNRKILLWNNPNIDQFSGVAIIEIGAKYVLIRRMSFTPSERSGRNMYRFLSEIQNKYNDKEIIGTLTTQALVTNWRKSNEYK